jgi:hypothetical protein
MPTAVQPNNSTTDTSHTVQVASSVALLVGLVAIIIFAVWISHGRHPVPTSSAFRTNFWVDQERLRKNLVDDGRYTLSSIPIVRYQLGLQKQVKGRGNEVPNADLPRGECQTMTANGGRALKQAPEDVPLSCPVCTDDFVESEKVRILPCGHIYHQHCIDPWLLERSGTCPMW